jgi:MYXO-CTERM domain-containing protein
MHAEVRVTRALATLVALVAVAAPAHALPTSVDWRNKDGFNWITPRRAQTGCGACWSFATIANVETLVAYRASTPDPTYDLAEQHLLDCAGASVDCSSGGITWGPPGTFLKNTGVTIESCYPYTSGTTGVKGTCQAVSSLPAECQAAVVRVEDLTEILSTIPSYPQWDPPPFTLSAAAMTEIKTWLQERPVGVSMRTFSDLKDYTGGVYEPGTGATSGGLHAVMLVGYNDTEGYWIVKNSWGPAFGENGFFRIKYNTSSIGMWGYVYKYREADKDPRFCDDLPTQISLDGLDTTARVDLHVANCGGAVLKWQASFDVDWLELDAPGGATVTAGAEVAVGTTYQLHLARAVGGGPQGLLTLTGGANGPILIPVYAEGPPQQDGGATDGGAPHDAAATDGGAPADGAPPADAPVPDGPGDAGGSSCGCAATSAGAGLFPPLALALVALALRRRRR